MTDNLSPSVLYFREPTADGAEGELKFLSFAATMEENHTGQATVSKYPVQKGFQVSNHLIRQNRVINIRAYIPEVIIGGIDPDGAEVGAKLAGVAGKFGVDVGGILPLAGGIISDPYGTATNYLEGAIGAAAPVIGSIASGIDTAVDWYTGGNPNGNLLGGETGLIGKYLPSTSRRISAFDMVKYIQERGIVCSLNTALHEYSDLVLVNYNIPTNSETYSVIYLDLTFEQILVVNNEGNVTANITNSKLTKNEKQNARIAALRMHQTTGTAKYITDFTSSVGFLDGIIA